MKIIKYTFFLALLFIQIQAQAAEVTFNVTIQNPTSTSLSLSIVDDVLSGEERGYMFNLRNGNQTSFILNIDKEEVLTFRYESAIFRIIVRPSDAPVISFDAYDVLGTLSATGAASNRAFLELQRRYPTGFPNTTYSNSYLPLNLDETLTQQAEYQAQNDYYAMLDQRRNDQLKIATDSRFLQNKINYENATYKLIYLLANKFQYTPKAAKKEARSIVSQLNLNDKSLLKYAFYTDALTAFTYVNHLSVSPNPEGEEFEYYEAINKNLTGKVRVFILSKLFYNAFRYGQIEIISRHYSTFKKENPYPEYTSKLDALFGERIQFDEDGFAPDFTLPDENGRIVSLTDYKGKVIYLSFWATWCKPCLSGFKKSESIRKELADMGVVLINVSVDRDPNVWKATMARVPMPGINLLSQDSAILNTYDAGSLPVYNIIDKNGNFAYLSEGFRDIKAEFRSLMEK